MGSIRCLSGLLSWRKFSTCNINRTKVALLGAAGGIGQPLSLLLKHSPYIKSLALYDVKDMAGIGMDLSHIDTSSEVYTYTGESQLASCLDGAEVVVITAGIPRKPGMDRKDLLDVNAKLIASFTEQIVKSTYNPMICVVTNPVNSLVPIVGEILKMNKVFDIRKLFGVTTLDLVRANTFYAELTGADARDVHVPVVGGHSGKTIVPLFSLATPKSEESLNFGDLIERVQNAGTEVVKAKKNDGSATLSMAFSGFRFVNSLLQARLGKRDLIEFAYVYNKAHDDVDYFADPFKLDHEGVFEFVDYPTITDHEKAMIAFAKAELKNEIKTAYDFIKEKYGVVPESKYNEIKGRASAVPFEKAWVTEETHEIERKKEPMPKSKLGSHIKPKVQGEGDKDSLKEN